MAKMAIYGHLAIEPRATNMGKWGIPEKNYQNVAQQCKLDHCSTLQTDFIAENCFLHILLFEFTIVASEGLGRAFQMS